MRGTYVNTATVVAGTLAGVALRGVLPQSYVTGVTAVVGIATLALGGRMFLQTRSPVVPIGAALVGMVIGQALGIEHGLNAVGEWFRAALVGDSEEPFAEAFVTTTIIFCVGPMTVLGCLEDGLKGKSPLLLVKSVFDGITALFFAAGMGWGVMLSAGAVLVIQGALTLAARPLSRHIEETGRVEEATACGGLILLALGLRILNVRQIEVANMLPGLLLASAGVALLTKRRWYP